MTDDRPAPDFYPIYEVRTALTCGVETPLIIAAERQQDEQMGSKRKFWFCDRQTSRWYLFKYSRDNAGEHWSEKLACELARLLGLPHAIVELAKHEGMWGVVVEDLRADRDCMSLLHGNELLFELDPTYPVERSYRVSEHTMARIEQALRIHAVGLPASSALPRDLPRAARLNGEGARGVQGYSDRARSALYLAPDDTLPMSPRGAFAAAARFRPQACAAWLSRCEAVGLQALQESIDRLPTSSVSEPAAVFAKALLRKNFAALLGPYEEST